MLDDGVTGAVAGLAEKGFHEGDNLVLTFFNAQGDVATASTIARSILNDPYDLVITMSTPSLQAVAGPNKDRRMHHVFGLVADPFAPASASTATTQQYTRPTSSARASSCRWTSPSGWPGS